VRNGIISAWLNKSGWKPVVSEGMSGGMDTVEGRGNGGEGTYIDFGFDDDFERFNLCLEDDTQQGCALPVSFG
jgi:hypothetical protein